MGDGVAKDAEHPRFGVDISKAIPIEHVAQRKLTGCGRRVRRQAGVARKRAELLGEQARPQTVFVHRHGDRGRQTPGRATDNLLVHQVQGGEAVMGISGPVGDLHDGGLSLTQRFIDDRV